MIPKLTTCEDYLILDGATVTGDVQLGRDVSVWFNAVIRADTNPIRVGDRTSIQDNAVLHTDAGGMGVAIGSDCVVGHGAIVHGCTVGDRTMIGMGATILSGARIGSDCIVGAGALVTGKTDAPDGSVLMGCPARVVRQMTDKDRAMIAEDVRCYLSLTKKYRIMVAADE